VGSDDDDNLGEFYDNPILSTELCNDAVISPEFCHGIIRCDHVHTTSEATSSSASMAADPSVPASREPQVHVPSVRALWDCSSQLVHGGWKYDQKESIRDGAHLENSISMMQENPYNYA
jgi:hypothetical protein